MLTKLYNVIIQLISSIILYLCWIFMGRWSKLNRLANCLEGLKEEEDNLCELLISLNEAYLYESNKIRERRKEIALERLKILEQIGQICITPKDAKTCEILKAPRIATKRKSTNKSIKDNTKSSSNLVTESVPEHMISGTNSYIDLLVEDTVQQFRETQQNDETMIRELYNDPAWRSMINDIATQHQLFSYLRTNCSSK